MGSFSDLPAHLQNAIYKESVVMAHKGKLEKVLYEMKRYKRMKERQAKEVEELTTQMGIHGAG